MAEGACPFLAGWPLTRVSQGLPLLLGQFLSNPFCIGPLAGSWLWSSDRGLKEAVQALGFRAQELCESRGGRPGLPVPNSPYGLCGHEATLNLNCGCACEGVLLLGVSGKYCTVCILYKVTVGQMSISLHLGWTGRTGVIFRNIESAWNMKSLTACWSPAVLPQILRCLTV